MGSLQEFKIKINSNKILRKSSSEQLHYSMNELLALGGLSKEQENRKESLRNELSRIPNQGERCILGNYKFIV